MTGGDRTMDQLAVEFCADTGGTFPMTWGQRDFWQRKASRYSGPETRHFNIPMVVDLPAGTGQAEVAAALRRLTERNQSLRTHFSDGPDGPVQRIARSGTFTVRLCQTAPEASRDHADLLAAELGATHFRHETEWGIRLALVCAGQEPRHLVFAIAHLVADGGAIQVLINDFFDLLGAQAGGSEPKGRWQPADQAGREQSARSARRNRAATGYWRKHLERIPPSMFGLALPVSPPRFHRLLMDSRALAAASARLAVDCQVSMASVVLAGAALALTAATGQPTCVLVVVVGNRYDEDMRNLLAPASQDGLFVVDVPGGTVAEAVRATHRAARSAYFYGHYDPGPMEELADELAVQRGVRFDLNSIFNDLSAFLDGADDPARVQGAIIPEADARKLLAETVIVPQGTWDGQLCKLYLGAEPGLDICRLNLVGDTAYLPLPTMEAVLRGIEKIVLEAAYRDVAVADIQALTGLKPTAG